MATPRHNREIVRATTPDEEVAAMMAGQAATILGQVGIRINR